MSEAGNMHLACSIPEQKNNPVTDTFATSVKAGQFPSGLTLPSPHAAMLPLFLLLSSHLTAQAWGLCAHPNTSGHQHHFRKDLDEAFSKPQGKQSRMEAGIEKERLYIFMSELNPIKIKACSQQSTLPKCGPKGFHKPFTDWPSQPTFPLR